MAARHDDHIDETIDQLISIAKLYYEDGLTQHEIAQLQGISRSSVSRLLERAHKQRLVQISVRSVADRDAALEQQLQSTFELRDAIVARSLASDVSEVLRYNIGRATALYLNEIVRAGDVVGISRGRTLYDVVRTLPRPTQRLAITVVQLMGHTTASLAGSHAGELARLLAEIYQGTCYNLHSPVLVPNVATRDGILSCAAIAPTIALYQQLRIAMVGIGSLSDSLFLLGGALSEDELAHLQAAGVVGEVCGRFVAADGHECESQLRDLVVSIEFDTLRRCEYVIGVAGGLSKVEAIKAFLSSKVINVLATDEITARALLGDGLKTR